MAQSEEVSGIKLNGRKKGLANGRRLRSSNFYITINTNKTVHDVYNLTEQESDYIAKFDSVWKRFFDKPLHEYLYLANSAPPSDTLENSISSIVMDGSTEYLSSRRKMIHGHILVQVKHYTKLQFNHADFRKYLAKEMDLPSSYVHIEAVSDYRVQSVLSYIKKEKLAISPMPGEIGVGGSPP